MSMGNVCAFVAPPPFAAIETADVVDLDGTDMLYSTKEGAGDFFLRVPDNPLLASVTAPKLRNFSVEIDVFRQYYSV
jgi:hypothetical protein